MRRFVRVAMVMLMLVANAPLVAQQAEDPAHVQLRALRDRLVDAMNRRDITGLLQHLHPDVVVTWQNAEVSRKPEGVRAYISRMLEGPESVVEQFSTTVNVDELTMLYGGDAGVAFGSSRDDFRLRNGQSFVLNSRWTATVVLDAGQWKIAAFHASASIFDNPLLAGTRRLTYIIGVVAVAAGLLAGLLAARLGRRRAGAV